MDIHNSLKSLSCKEKDLLNDILKLLLKLNVISLIWEKSVYQITMYTKSYVWGKSEVINFYFFFFIATKGLQVIFQFFSFVFCPKSMSQVNTMKSIVT